MLISRGIGTIQKENISWENSLGTEWLKLTFHSQQVSNCKIAHMIPYSSVPAMPCDVSFREKTTLNQFSTTKGQGVQTWNSPNDWWRNPMTISGNCERIILPNSTNEGEINGKLITRSYS